VSEESGLRDWPDTPGERLLRIALWAVLAVSWVVAVAYMWDAMTMVPSAERLEESKVVGIPTPRTFFTSAIFSGMELAVVLAALWPWRPEFYATRLGITGLGLVTWFIMTTPMDLSRMDWVHRRWLAFMVLAIVVALVALAIQKVGRRLIGRGERIQTGSNRS
jgi:hypothetical protein